MSTITSEQLNAAMREAYKVMREANPTEFITITSSFSGHPFNTPCLQFEAAYVLPDKSQPRGSGDTPMEAALNAVKELKAHDPLAEAKRQLEAAGYAVVSPD